VDINPNFHDGQFTLGASLAYAGLPDEAVAAFKTAVRLSPYDPFAWATYGLMGLAHYLAGRYEEALDAAERATRVRPRYILARALKAAAHGQLGNLPEAKCELATLSRQSLDKLANLPIRREPDLRHLFDGLRMLDASVPAAPVRTADYAPRTD
jgi:tetratricopeptide (TPR) repeat protein